MDFISKSVDYPSLLHLFPKTFRILERYEIVGGDVFVSIAGVNLGIAGVFRPTIPDQTILTENAAKIQLRIVKVLKQFEGSLADQDQNLSKLRSLKTALMQDLLTGKVG